MIHSFIAEHTNANLNFNIELEKDKQVYCFIGENGSGKTNLLENLAKAILFCHSVFLSKERKNNKDLKFAGILSRESILLSKFKDTAFELAANIQINDKQVLASTSKLLVSVQKLAESRYNQSSPISINKPVVFISARNRGYTENLDKNEISVVGDSSERFIEFFSQTINAINGISFDNKNIVKWISSRLIINPAFAINVDHRHFEVITLFELIERLESKWKLIWKDGNNTVLNVEFSDGKLLIGNIPLDKLPTGFISIIKIFQEIIAGYGAWTINEMDLKQVEGIVFIDEIESHLHPKWQHHIIPLLKEFFPKTTFYIATHSPVIVSTTEQDEAYELIREENNVTARKLGNPKEWYLADLLTHAFHIELQTVTKPEDTENLIDLLKSFSTKVKDYVASKDENLKQDAETLYQQIIPSLPPTDPRRRSLDSLKSLL
ncbi:AAA family ATPase [Candidatus Albibeggiatoa sp. nov. BB20]|uniref:AAA family ATPase n=1 Tax=Candidatus Albibeggiatoa sp. nov. BB20 TaxID=3162723 RepID=UPI00336557C9